MQKIWSFTGDAGQLKRLNFFFFFFLIHHSKLLGRNRGEFFQLAVNLQKTDDRLQEEVRLQMVTWVTLLM